MLRDPTGIVIDTAGGTGYLLEVPLGVFERLPAAGEPVQLHTELVVREDAWSLYGFDGATERAVFRRLMGASGVGPRLALAILSALGPERTVRAIRDKDLAALASVSGIGKKKAERIALELGDRLDDLPAAGPAEPHASADAVRALVALGYIAASGGNRGARGARRRDVTQDTAALVRRALSNWSGSRRDGVRRRTGRHRRMELHALRRDQSEAGRGRAARDHRPLRALRPQAPGSQDERPVRWRAEAA